MDLIKRHLIVIICGLAGVLSLVGLAFGVLRFDKVKDLMQQAQDQVDRLAALENGVSVQGTKMIPNAQAIEILQQQRNAIKSQFYQKIQVSLHKNIGLDPSSGQIRSKPLLDGVFPEPVTQAKSYEFPDAYKKAFEDLLEQLDAGTAPSAEDIADQTELVRQEWGFLLEPTSPNQRRRGMGDDTEMQILRTAREEAEIQRAKSIKTYAGMNNFHILQEVVRSVGAAPAVHQMWWAQMSLWIQQYVVDAIAAVNATADNVSQSVVKQIRAISVDESYILKDSRVGSGRASASMDPSFSGRSGNDLYDMLQFSITVVVDSTRLMEFIDEMHRQNFFTLYSWDISSIDLPSDAMAFRAGSRQGGQPRFGPDPVVVAVLQWEAYFLQDYYHYGIVGYGINETDGKPYLSLLDGTKKVLDDPDDRKGLKGLMPKELREAITGKTDDKEAGPAGRSGRRATRRAARAR